MFSFKYIQRIVLYFLVLFALTLILNSCKDDPLEPDMDHFEAEGLVLYQSGIKVAEIFRGVTQDTLSAVLGQTSTHFEVKFYNSSKQELDPPDHTKQPFAWEIQDTSLVGVWQHPGEEGSYEFHLVGKQLGLTQIEFFIMHEGHADFRSGKFPVKITN
ncbi:hypothetical protein [Ignavibacterium sp.]|uniref:hypothetical protein n=1 Tax=Ignavibacterium sp. TaxID=2651167 RepID=UPI00220B13B0|nr:hypothetical protein [Ignavibacterium sp.]BDQ02135.1 MAG: hypothetical protein KatS3mg037_0710 [Ignavibacterium sp.]